MKKTLLLLTFMIGVGAATVAQAQDHPVRHHRHHRHHRHAQPPPR